MGDRLKAGSFADYNNSLAELIDDRLNSLLIADGLPGLSMEPSEARDRRRLFLAIAQGIVEHLSANKDAFKLQVTGHVRTDGTLDTKASVTEISKV